MCMHMCMCSACAVNVQCMLQCMLQCIALGAATHTDLRVVRVLVELVRDELCEEVREHRGARRLVGGGGGQVEAEVRLGVSAVYR